MNIYDSLKENSIEFSLEYFGLNDVATNYDVKCILQNKDYINNYYMKGFTGKIETFDDYVDYLVFAKIIMMEELIDDLKSKEHKENIFALIEHLKSIKVNRRLLIIYINDHIREIMKEAIKYRSLVEATMELITRYCTGISDDAFKYLAKEHYHLLFYNYDKLQKTIESRVNVLSTLLSDINIKNVLYSRDLKIVLEIVFYTYEVFQNTIKNSSTEKCII